MICFFDLETTSKDVYNAEIITGYFELVYDGEAVANYHFQSQVNKWSEEAEEIHGISYYEMKNFPVKEKALYMLNNFLSNIPEGCKFWCYSNPNNMGQYIIYDKAIIEMELMYNDLSFKFDNIDTVYLMAKLAYTMGLFDPVKSESNRNSFKQEAVYRALFDEEYDSHKAYDDVQAMKKIFYELEDMINNNRQNKNKMQLSLL